MRKKFRKKQFFNMIEVCLALGVMAVGVIGAVAILPSAIKTSEIATNDVYLADAVNIIFAQIDREVNRLQIQYDKEYQEIAADWDDKIDNEQDPAKKQQLLEDKINDLKDFREKKYEDFENLFASSSNQGQNNVCEAEIWELFPDGIMFTSDITDTGSDGAQIQMNFRKNPGARLGIISLYQVFSNTKISEPGAPDSYQSAAMLKQSGSQPFFRAMVRIYSTPIAYDPEAGSDENKSDAIRKIERDDASWEVVNYKSEDGANLKGLIRLENTKASTIDMDERRKAHWRRVYVEFSYPVNVPIARRTKKVFVKEYYLMD